MNFYEIIIGLIVLLVALPVFFLGAPFLPSYRKANEINFQNLFELLRELGVRKFIDLGSGDGRAVKEFAKAGFESYGIEINPLLVWWSVLKIKRHSLNAKIKWGNFWQTDLSSFDAIFFFQCESTNKILVRKFKKELKSGAIIISAHFPLEGLEYIKKEGFFLIYRI